MKYALYRLGDDRLRAQFHTAKDELAYLNHKVEVRTGKIVLWREDDDILMAAAQPNEVNDKDELTKTPDHGGVISLQGERFNTLRLPTEPLQSLHEIMISREATGERPCLVIPIANLILGGPPRKKKGVIAPEPLSPTPVTVQTLRAAMSRVEYEASKLGANLYIDPNDGVLHATITTII